VLRLWVALALAIAVNPAYAAPKKKKPGIVKRVVAHLKAPPSEKSPAPTAAVERLGRGYKAYVDGQYELAKKELRGIDPKQMQNADYVLYLLAQSELLTGEPKPAREHFHELTLMPSRFATVAKWRVADCDWDAGDFETARKGYEAVLPSANENIVEAAVARFRIGEALAKKGALPAAQHEWRKVYVGEPMHPLAETALARLVDTKAPPITPEERIARAKVMTANRAWPKALEELALVPDGVPQAVRDEADYWFGTTKFKMRRDYDVAAQKLLGVWQRLPGDDRKVDALFHGSRAWSRADKDDEAQKGYRELLQKYPRSKASPEASFLIGWLDFNRAKYKEAIPGLEDTLKKYGSSQFGDDARWYLGFSRWLEGDVKGALGDFEILAKMPGALSGGKGAYWRGRALDALKRTDEAKSVWRALVDEYPFSYYALQARARLKEHGVELGPFGDGPRGSAPPLAELDIKLANDPLIMRVDELLLAGLTVEAGEELARGEREFIKRYGAARALPVLFDRYVRGDNFNRPHSLAESYAGSALRMDPTSDANVRKWWEVVYPRAYQQLLLASAHGRTLGQRLGPWLRLRPRHFKPVLPAVVEPRTGLSMGQSAELTAQRWRIGREEQDRLAYESHMKATAAWRAGFYDDLVVPCMGLKTDNNVRPDTSLEKLSRLRASFDPRDGTLTAGNSTPLTDGASAVLLASEEWAARRGLPVLAWLRYGKVWAVDFAGGKEGLLMAPVYAVPAMLRDAGLALRDFDYYEIHEAFAAQVLCTLAAWESPQFCREVLGLEAPLGAIDRARLNVKGGSVAIGHPFAATGTRIVATLAKLLAGDPAAKRGLISVCTAGGMGVTAIVER